MESKKKNRQARKKQQKAADAKYLIALNESTTSEPVVQAQEDENNEQPIQVVSEAQPVKDVEEEKDAEVIPISEQTEEEKVAEKISIEEASSVQASSNAQYPKSVQQAIQNCSFALWYTLTSSDHLQMPYREKELGFKKLLEGKFQEAIPHFEKALYGMKALFEGIEGVQPSIISDRGVAVKYIREIEIPCQLNLAQCYLTLDKYHQAILYCTSVLEKDDECQKAYFRRGLAYVHVNELNKAQADLEKSNRLANGTDPSTSKALETLRQKRVKQQEAERDFSKKMLQQVPKANPPVPPLRTINEITPTSQIPQQAPNAPEQGQNPYLTEKQVRFLDSSVQSSQGRKYDAPVPAQRTSLDLIFSLILVMIGHALKAGYYLYENVVHYFIDLYLRLVFFFKYFYQISMKSPTYKITRGIKMNQAQNQHSLFFFVRYIVLVPFFGPRLKSLVNWAIDFQPIRWLTKYKLD